MGPVINGTHESVFEPLRNQNRERLLFRRAPEVTLERCKRSIRTRQRGGSHWLWFPAECGVQSQAGVLLKMESHSSALYIKKQPLHFFCLTELLAGHAIARLPCRGQNHAKAPLSRMRKVIGRTTTFWASLTSLASRTHSAYTPLEVETTGTKAQLWLLFLRQKPRVMIFWAQNY